MNKNESAFPGLGWVDNQDGFSIQFEGLSKREYFAGLAMQGILAHAASNWPIKESPESLVSCAVQTAEALIEELAREYK